MTSRIRRLTFASIVLALCLAGRVYAFSLIQIDPAAEQKLGAAIDQYMHGIHKFSYRLDWEWRLHRIGNRLEGALGDPGRGLQFHYEIVREDYPNMLSACAGYMYASTGLMEQGFDDDELAGIMAHEMVHVVKHHVAKSYALVYHSLNFDMAVANRAIKDLQMYHNSPAGPFQLYRYAERTMDRSFENEADILGVHLAARAGFDPYGHARALKVLLKSDQGRHYTLKELLLMTHPPSQERIARIETEAAKVSKH